jgi:hypothetical protein
MQRRTFIGGLVIAPVVSGLPGSRVLAAETQRATLAIVDRNLEDASFMADRLVHESARLHTFAGDPGRLWMDTLEPELRRMPVSIAGYTSGATLFCLQYLTRDYGLELQWPAVTLEPQAAFDGQAGLVDLRDSGYENSRAAVTWLLAPKRG